MSSIVKVDTIQENTSANGITVDGLNIKDSKLVTANSVVASNITADAIDATKIADNAISEEHLDVTSITGHTAETSIADGDTILIHDASASALRKMTKANFVSGIGGDNTPAFAAFQSSGQNIDSGTTTIVTLDTEIFDTDSAFASNKFTVPSGEGGKYYVSAAIRADASWAATGQFNVMVFVGGTTDNGLFASYNIAASNGNGGAVSGILDLPAGEEITMRLYHNEGGTEGLQAGRYCTVFSGYKLIGI